MTNAMPDIKDFQDMLNLSNGTNYFSYNQLKQREEASIEPFRFLHKKATNACVKENNQETAQEKRTK